METTQAEQTPSLSNREMAAVLFNIATCLREAGNENPYRTAAYERGARALMGLRTEAQVFLSEAEKVPFRERQHIGTKLQAKIGEMTRTGALNQYAALLAELPPHRAEFMLISGIGPKTADVIHSRLGISTRAELVRAARDGRLRTVPGFGLRRTAAIAKLSLPAVPAWDLFSLPLREGQ